MNIYIQFLTWFRVAAGPIIFVLVAVLHFYGLALFFFILASASDYWDGYLAKKYNLTSVMGEILDPIADKILITFVLMALTINLGSWFIGLIGATILAREFLVGGLRDFNSRIGNSKATKVTFLAKTKTAVQFVTFSCFLLGLFLNNALILFTSNFFLVASLIITLQTGLTYTISTLATSEEQ